MIVDVIKSSIRSAIRILAVWLDKASGSRITPSMVTTASVVMHIPIAYLTAVGELQWAALLLIIFGLFDVLDGELARLQKRATRQGMLYDASTDRIKETLIYTGVAAYLVSGPDSQWAFLAVVASGASITVAYVKAKGEAALALKKNMTNHHRLNRYFNEGVAPFEIRITIIVLGLLFSQVLMATVLVAILATVSVFMRLQNISRQIAD